jgi:hypothetical protein
MWFMGEWWNDASSDNIAYIFGLLSQWKILNFNQIISLLLMVWGSWRLAHIIPSPLSEGVIRIGDRVIKFLKHAFGTFEKKRQKYLKKGKKYILLLKKSIKRP